MSRKKVKQKFVLTTNFFFFVTSIQFVACALRENLSNRSSGGQIPRDICTRFGRYLYSTKCSWIIKQMLFLFNDMQISGRVFCTYAGFGSRNSKSSPRRVPRETRATELYVALEVFSDRSAQSDSWKHLLIRLKISAFPKSVS